MSESELFPRSWRSSKQYLKAEEKELPVSEANFIQTQRRLIEEIKAFIQAIFNYNKIEIKYSKLALKNNRPRLRRKSRLQFIRGHSSYTFGVNLYDNSIHEFVINNIPALADNKHIEVFFNVIKEYLRVFYRIMGKNLDSDLYASPKLMLITDSLIYNLEKTFIIEYLFDLFNTYDENYNYIPSDSCRPLRYEIDLLNRIYTFSVELSNRKIENEEVCCGFIFHDKVEHAVTNAEKVIKLTEPLEFGDFDGLKKLMSTVNGRNIFFNVTGNKITHILITKKKVKEIIFTPTNKGKNFTNRPLIVSIQGEGKIYFIEGRTTKNRVLLQIINSKPIIRDNEFIRMKLLKSIKLEANLAEEKINIFINWILSLSLQKHGATIIIGDFDKKLISSLIKSIPISFPNGADYLEDKSRTFDIELLNYLVKPDGAVIFNSHLVPFLIGSLLPFSKAILEPTEGSRHNSTLNFTKKNNCLGIVISEDGPISIFRKGKRIVKF